MERWQTPDNRLATVLPLVYKKKVLNLPNIYILYIRAKIYKAYLHITTD